MYAYTIIQNVILLLHIDILVNYCNDICNIKIILWVHYCVYVHYITYKIEL